MNKERDWTVYLLECSDGTLYCGITTDINRRIKQHNSGKGAKYTRGRAPVKLVAKRDNMTHSQALKFEYFVKKIDKAFKVDCFDSLYYGHIDFVCIDGMLYGNGIWYHSAFPDPRDQNPLQEEMKIRGFEFDKDGTITHAPAIIMAMINCIERNHKVEISK